MKREVDSPLFKTRAFSMDIARQPEPMGVLKQVIREGAKFHFNQFHLYVENQLQLEAYGAAKAGLTRAEVRELVDFAQGLGIEIVPILNLLGHTEHFLKHESFRHLSENREGPRQRDQDWQNCLCPSLPETGQWAAQVVREVAEWFPSPNLHAGLDETWLVGSCSLCRKRAEQIGLGGIFAEFSNFLNAEVRRQGKTMWIAADMLLHYKWQDVVPRLSREIVLVDWFYDKVATTPEVPFFNWRRMDTTRLLLAAGFKTVASGCCRLGNVVTFSRYLEHLPVDAFLVTQWEGFLTFQDNYRTSRCAIGHFLYHGQVPDWEELGHELLPSYSAADQRAFFLAEQASDDQLETAIEALRDQKETALHRATRAALLQRHVRKQKGELETELRIVARDMLRSKAATSGALARGLMALDKTLAYGNEWLALLDELAAEYGDDKSVRPLYRTAADMVRELEMLREGLMRFMAAPTPANLFFPAVELVVELVPLDLCAHACRVEVSADGKQYETVYQTSFLFFGPGRETPVRMACSSVPRFVRFSVGGFARLAVANVRCETIMKDLVPTSIVRTGGEVISPEHLLAWDQKTAIFNEPDVEKKWSGPDRGVQHFVELEFSPA